MYTQWATGSLLMPSLEGKIPESFIFSCVNHSFSASRCLQTLSGFRSQARLGLAMFRISQYLSVFHIHARHVHLDLVARLSRLNPLGYSSKHRQNLWLRKGPHEAVLRGWLSLWVISLDHLQY